MLTLADLLHALAPSHAIETLHDSPSHAVETGHFVVAQAAAIPIRQVCIDSRQAGGDSLFVALAGEHTDGHRYVGDAFARGATVALVERPIPDATHCLIRHGRIEIQGPESPALRPPVAVVVPDALAALQQFARATREGRPDLRVIGVTGSVGKTTAKEAIAAVLGPHRSTLKSAGNHNNEIGLPLTLLKLTLAHEYAVLEMGMYALGEIELLCSIAEPQVGVVTNVGPTHLERLGTIERIAQAKAELVEALPADGVAVLNGSDPRVRAMATKTQANVVTYGLRTSDDGGSEPLDVYAVPSEIVVHGLGGIDWVAHVADPARWNVIRPSAPLHTPIPGRHAVWPALTAVAVGLVEGLTWEQIRTGLAMAGGSAEGAADPGRLRPVKGIHGATILNDSYNSSPASALAALDLLHELPGRHVAVLGDMLELGAYEVEGHRRVGERCAAVVDRLITVGERARHIAQGALDAGMNPDLVRMAEDNEEAIDAIRSLLRSEDVVLIKGSRGMAMDEIVAALTPETEVAIS